MAPAIQSKLVLPNQRKIVTSASRLEEQQQQLYEAAQVMKGAHIHALAEAYLAETGLKAEETMLVEETSRDGLGKRYFFLKKPEAAKDSSQKSSEQPVAPSSDNTPASTASASPT
jgi:hypothetical protein